MKRDLLDEIDVLLDSQAKAMGAPWGARSPEPTELADFLFPEDDKERVALAEAWLRAPGPPTSRDFGVPEPLHSEEACGPDPLWSNSTRDCYDEVVSVGWDRRSVESFSTRESFTTFLCHGMDRQWQHLRWQWERDGRAPHNRRSGLAEGLRWLDAEDEWLARRADRESARGQRSER